MLLRFKHLPICLTETNVRDDKLIRTNSSKNYFFTSHHLDDYLVMRGLVILEDEISRGNFERFIKDDCKALLKNLRDNEIEVDEKALLAGLIGYGFLKRGANDKILPEIFSKDGERLANKIKKYLPDLKPLTLSEEEVYKHFPETVYFFKQRGFIKEADMKAILFYLNANGFCPEERKIDFIEQFKSFFNENQQTTLMGYNSKDEVVFLGEQAGKKDLIEDYDQFYRIDYRLYDDTFGRRHSAFSFIKVVHPQTNEKCWHWRCAKI